METEYWVFRFLFTFGYMNTFIFNGLHSIYINDDMIRYPNLISLNQNGGVFLPFMDNHFKIYGCHLPNTSVVKYRQGEISYYSKKNNSIGISFEFSGCAMAQFSYLDQTYIAHISLHQRGNAYDAGSYWNAFLEKIVNNGLGSRYTNFKLFKPFDQTAETIIRNHGLNYDCCGIIDQQGICYSAIVSKINCSAIQMWQRSDAIIVNGRLLSTNVHQLTL